MRYVDLNNNHKKRIEKMVRNDILMKWEDDTIFQKLLGKIIISGNVSDNEITRKFKMWSNSYNFFNVTEKEFLTGIGDVVSTICSTRPELTSLYNIQVKNCYKMHKFSLISGYGGIGKSHFMKTLSDEFTKNYIPHLCIYGKLISGMSEFSIINVNEIIDSSKNGFVFVVDAINELNKECQIKLIEIIRELKKHPKIRIILTYRTNSLEESILEQFKKLSEFEVEFLGVSIESALLELKRQPIIDVDKYEDILFSNNPLYITLLCRLLQDDKIENEEENSINSITYVLEGIIKKSLSKDMWLDTKKIAKWMFENDEKVIDLKSVENLIKNAESYFKEMVSLNFLYESKYNGVSYYTFHIDKLSDALITRELFNSINNKTVEEIVEVIKYKMEKIPSLKEYIILLLFDKYSPDYEKIFRIVKETGLTNYCTYEILSKINFKEENIQAFTQIIDVTNSGNLFLSFGGYINKPFNCNNYFNDYFAHAERQRDELTRLFVWLDSSNSIKLRLKNLIYFISVKGTEKRLNEAFYFAIWCSCASEIGIRYLANKLLFEIVLKNASFIDKLIELYGKVYDDYIKEGIILVLAYQRRGNEKVENFFITVIKDEKNLFDRSVKRIATYLGDEFGYIKWDRENYYSKKKETPSEWIDNIIFHIHIYDKYTSNIKYNNNNKFELYEDFVNIKKENIIKVNEIIHKEFECTKRIDCYIDNEVSKYIDDEFDNFDRKSILDNDSFLNSFEHILKQIMDSYALNEETEIKNIYGERFTKSVFRKCYDIAQSVFWGSIMCNYYTNKFSSSYKREEQLGNIVYNPFVHGDVINIITPIVRFDFEISEMNEDVLSKIQVPKDKDVNWAKDVNLTKSNLMETLKPIVKDDVEWCLIAGDIHIDEMSESDKQDKLLYRDTYIIKCCTNPNEVLERNGDERYLTIETKSYDKHISDYILNQGKSWLCHKIKSLSENFNDLDKSNLILPPADLIRCFNLEFNFEKSSWVSNEGAEIIKCDNLRNEYFENPICSTIYIRKDYLEEYEKNNIIKYFTFTERYIEETGYADETAIHFEIIDKNIVNEVYNKQERFERGNLPPKSNECENCRHLINKTIKFLKDKELLEEDLEMYKNLLDDLSYIL